MPHDGKPVARLGFLTDFAAGWAALRNPARDLAAVLSWDADALPHAWFWPELSYTAAFPWFGRAYVSAGQRPVTGVKPDGSVRHGNDAIADRT